MAADVPQSYANHRRFVPGYHYVVSAIFVVNLLWQLWQAVRAPSFGTLLGVLMAGALIALFYYVRLFPLNVQDRVIRLEEQLRLERLCPAELRPRLGELTASQLIGLRFASDEELPELARRVLDEPITSREAIKRQIRSWRADTMRA